MAVAHIFGRSSRLSLQPVLILSSALDYGSLVDLDP
jgi:hypothetical protein